MSRERTAVLAAAAVAVGLIATTGAEAATRKRFECKAKGQIDISMSVRYEIRGTGPSARRKFSTEFEAAPNVGFSAGDKIRVSVDGTNVGSTLLEEIVGGDLVGDLNFDTKPREGDADPFPPNFPSGVGKGSEVAVLKAGGALILGCTLKP